MKRIDTHQHFWHYTTEDYGWIDDSMSGLKQDFLPETLRPLLDQAGVDETIAVQARQTLQETEWLLELASHNGWIAGVVGWVDLCSEDIEEQLARYSSHQKLVGVRHVLHDEEDERFCLRDDFMRGISHIEKYNLTYDVLIKPPHLPYANELITRFPEQRFVIDHIAKPLIADGVLEPWSQGIRDIAMLPNTWCKLSGMVTEAAWDTWTYDDLLPYMDIVLEAFGSERLLVGSDWPVCTLCGTYDEVTGVAKRFLETLTESQRDRIWESNPHAAYTRLT